MENKALLKKIINIAGRVITLLSIIFVVRAIYRLGFDLTVIKDIPAFVALGLVSAVVFAAGVYIQGLAWKSWLSFFSGDGEKSKGAKVDTRGALCVYARANIGKYLPGNVMHYVERNLFAQESGASQTAVALSSVFEIGSQVAVAMLIAIASARDTVAGVLSAMFGEGWHRAALIGAVAAVVLLVLFIVVALKLLGEKIRKIFAGYSISGFILTLIKAMFLYMTVMLIGGAIMAVLYVHMGGVLTPHGAFVVVSGYVIAWVLGFVVPGAPGGIGVREFVLTMTVGPVVGAELVLTLMVIHRLINIIGDFIAYVFSMILEGKHSVRSREEGSKESEPERRRDEGAKESEQDRSEEAREVTEAKAAGGPGKQGGDQ